MKSPAVLAVCFLVLIIFSGSSAQNSLDRRIVVLQKEIVQREAIDRDRNTPEIHKAINRQVLAERRRELSAALQQKSELARGYRPAGQTNGWPATNNHAEPVNRNVVSAALPYATPKPTATPKAGPAIPAADGADKSIITLTPSHPGVSPGATVDIVAGVPEKDGKPIAKPDDIAWTIADDMKAYLAIVGPGTGLKITVIGLKVSPPLQQSMPTTVPVVAIATLADGTRKTAVISIRLEIAPVAAGPIPPGLDPQVDVMWAVVPKKIVADNFGRGIAKRYYAAEVVIGNNTGYDLQVASVGFEKSKVSSENIIPSTGYRMARGSFERTRDLYPRSFVLNGIRALGPILVGFNPFFHNLSHSANFSQGVNIFSDPIEKGIDLFWPDLTIGEMNRLQDALLRDDVTTRTVVPNNTQVRTVVLIPKDLLALQKNVAGGRDDPATVMRQLGHLVLIGNRIQFLNRERIVALPANAGEFMISGRITDACDNGVKDVAVSLQGPADFAGKTATTDANGAYSFTRIPSNEKYIVNPKSDDATFIIDKTRGLGLQTFTLDEDKQVNFTATLNTYTITGKVTGNDLKKVQVILNDKPDSAKDLQPDGSYSFTNAPKNTPNKVSVKLPDDKKKWKVLPGADLSLDANCNEKHVDFSISP